MSKAISHFYLLDKYSSSEEVNKDFEQSFLHIHVGDQTILVRKMNYTGIKIDPNSDLMKEVLDLALDQPDIKEAIEKFLNDE